MPRTLHEIGAAVPFGGLRRVRLVGTGIQVQRLPHCHRPANPERGVVPGRDVAHGFQRAQVRVQVGNVLLGQSRVERVRKCGEQMPAVGGDALAQRALQVLRAPVADSGLGVRRDVGRVDRAERRGERAASGIRGSALARVAPHAIGGRRDVATSLGGGRGLVSKRAAGECRQGDPEDSHAALIVPSAS